MDFVVPSIQQSFGFTVEDSHSGEFIFFLMKNTIKGFNCEVTTFTCKITLSIYYKKFTFHFPSNKLIINYDLFLVF